MNRRGRALAGLFVGGLALGTAGGPARIEPVVTPDGEHVLAGDFHVHSFLGDGVLAPWDLAREARRRGLDVIAITNHNQVFSARVGRWFAQGLGAPIVLVGQEVTAPAYHMAAVGLTATVDWRLTAAQAAEAIHRQGGAAIAAHPRVPYWPGLADARAALDGVEVAHPVVFASAAGRRELEEFYGHVERRGWPVSAIGSSDFHVLSALGTCRTYVFVRERSEGGVLEALRRGRTVVVDDRGRIFGDAARRHRLPSLPAPPPVRTPLESAGTVSAMIGLVGLVVLAREA